MSVVQRTLVTAPTTEPLTVIEAKLHLRVEDDGEEDLIKSLIVAARRHVEQVTRRALITQTWRVTLDTFPDDLSDGTAGLIRLPYPPLVSVTSVAYTDTAGASATHSALLYGAEPGALPGQLRLVYGEVWPTTRAQPNAVTITYVAGYGAASAVPDDIKAAMRLLIGHLFENREAVVTGTIATAIPKAVDALLAPYLVLEFS